MEGRNLIVNSGFLADYLNDFRHEIFTMSWKPIMLFKLERVCCKNVTPTDIRSAGQHPRSYEQATDQDDAVLFLEINMGRSVSRSKFTHPFELAARNTSGQSVTDYPQVSSVLVATPLEGILLGNTSSISRYPFSGSLEVTENTTAETLIEPMMATVTPKGDVGIMTNTFKESMIDNQFIINNQVTNLKRTTQIIATPENGNPIEEKGEISNPSPNVHTIQPKAKKTNRKKGRAICTCF